MIGKFTEEKIQKVNKSMKRSSNSLVIRETEINQWDMTLHLLNWREKRKRERKLHMVKCWWREETTPAGIVQIKILIIMTQQLYFWIINPTTQSSLHENIFKKAHHSAASGGKN